MNATPTLDTLRAEYRAIRRAAGIDFRLFDAAVTRYIENHGVSYPTPFTFVAAARAVARTVTC